MGREGKMPLHKRFLPQPPEELRLKLHKRSVDSSSVHGAVSDFTFRREGLPQNKQQTSSGAVDYLHPSSISDSGMYGCVSLKNQSLIHHHAMNPAQVKDYLGLESCTSEDPRQTKQLISCNVIDLEDDNDSGNIGPLQVRSLPSPLIILSSDDEEEHSNQQREVISNQLGGDLVMMNFEIQPSTQRDVNQTGGHLQAEKAAATDADDDDEEEEEEEEGNEMPNADDDGLKEFWDVIEDEIKEEKKNAVGPSSAAPAAECDHSFILRDDVGYVCRVCGVIRQSIETIIEYQFTKARNTRTYPYEGRTRRDPDDSHDTDYIPGESDARGHDFEFGDVSAHPRHRKQMKPHQIEGFNFLLRNLVTENPGGCIMAHAPGSGKTFMVISFLQSFMTKLPSARPLVILPRGILATWKKEFLRWQVEDIPLFDFYSVKADSRAQQLEVLKRWRDQRSILLLGYKQFSSIVCDNGSTAYQCHRILLKVPNIVILDEGHTPRNQDTDILTSLEKIETPRKVVLSGTLYQNHVKEVFNILNLVRPKFLRLDSSKEIRRRIMSKVSMDTRRDSLRKGSDNEFYEVVEHTLVKDEDFKRKAMVIQDLRQMTGKVLHYYKGDFLDELPGLVDFTVILRLSPRQQHGVAELRKLNRKFKITSEGSALYVHPQLSSFPKIPVAKDRDHRVDVEIDAILENLDESEGVKAKFFLNLLHLCESSGEKLLVFSQYILPLKFLERLSVKVKGYRPGKEIFMITGEQNNDEREISMERFNSSPDARVFCGSIRACGEGISLVGASRILILDIHLNPSVTRQAIGRAFRPGQVRKVFVYRLVAGASPEEEDHLTCFKKESIAKMWFEWNVLDGYHAFKMETVDTNNCGDDFWETPGLREDLMCVYRR